MWMKFCIFVFAGQVLGSVVPPIDSQIGSPRIIGGHEAARGAYPWQVSIQYQYETSPADHECGGSIINEQWILTAAHCCDLANFAEFLYLIVAGDHNQKIEEGSEQRFRIEKLYRHENYATSTLNDICLMKIAGKFVFNQYVKPISLALPQQDSMIEGNKELYCVTSGWGRLTPAKGSSPDVLQALVMPLLPQQTCNDRVEEIVLKFNESTLDTKLDEGMLCSGYLEGRKTPCKGDSGGPLACLIDDKWTLTGIASFVIGSCSEPVNPAVFTRVTYYHDWITNKMALR